MGPQHTSLAWRKHILASTVSLVACCMSCRDWFMSLIALTLWANVVALSVLRPERASMRLEENDRSAWNIDASFKANGTRTLVTGVEVFFAACSRGQRIGLSSMIPSRA
jgi:hypothetical protein